MGVGVGVGRFSVLCVMRAPSRVRGPRPRRAARGITSLGVVAHVGSSSTGPAPDEPGYEQVTLEALQESLETVVDLPDSGDLVADLRVQTKGATRLLGSPTVRTRTPRR